MIFLFIIFKKNSTERHNASENTFKFKIITRHYYLKLLIIIINYVISLLTIMIKKKFHLKKFLMIDGFIKKIN